MQIKMNFHFKFINYSQMISLAVLSIMNGSFLIAFPENMFNATRLSSYHCLYEYQMFIITSVVFLILAITLLISIFTIERNRMYIICIS